MTTTATKTREAQINTTKGLSEKTIAKIQEELQTALLKRGFTAKIALSETTTHRGEYKLKLTSEKFNTVPVIMKSIEIGDFGICIFEDKEEPKRLCISIPVHVGYEHFSGGSNGTELFRFFCKVYDNDADLYSVTIQG